jgi:hypothetical protein
MKPVNSGGETIMYSNLTILKSALLALGVFLFAAPEPALAAEKTAAQKLYPPYPDVWGRELPIPKGVLGEISAGNLNSGVYEGVDGRILVEFSYQDRPGAKSRGRRFLYDFFAGPTIKDWPASEFKKRRLFLEANGYRQLKNIVGTQYGDRIRLPDGSHFSETDGDAIYITGLRRFDASGRQLYHWVIFYISEQPYFSLGNEFSEFFNGRRYAHFRALDISPKLFPLRDGTFLLAGGTRPVFMRVRNNLSSPYIKRSGNIALIDPKITEQMFTESWFQAERILSRLRKQNPNQPWVAPEVTDEIMLSKLKNIIKQQNGVNK